MQANRLVDTDAGEFAAGNSDPYVAVTVPSGSEDPHIQKTAVVPDELNPVWNEQKIFKISQPGPTDGAIRFEVFDSDNFVDESLGFVEVPWPFWENSAGGAQRAPVCGPLKSAKEEATVDNEEHVTGWLLCNLLWVPSSHVDNLEGFQYEGAVSTVFGLENHPVPMRRGVLFVKVVIVVYLIWGG